MTVDTEEVRVAMALNGGVSLAVWMGGCAIELDCARRAHLGEEEVSDTSRKPPPRTVYHAVCRAFRRTLVLDLMSGSSAGGINGALLATAIVNGRRLPPQFIRDKWLKLGDFSQLLHRTSESDPQSLMRGRYFKQELRTAFASLVEGDDALNLPAAQREQLASEVTLQVTTTDVAGLRRTFRDAWGEELVAHEHRAQFSFSRPEHYRDPERLATAARSSASFPGAFEPARVKPRHDGTFDGWAIDGGVLDNAPIKTVLDLIPTRRADGPVQRFVLYLFADPPLSPEQLSKQEAEAADPDAADEAEACERCVPPMPGLPKVIGYALNLPRSATFVDHLSAVERATSAGDLHATAQASLLSAGMGPLVKTARTLLPTYRERRRLVSIRDLVREPSLIEPVFDAVRSAPDRDLPWVPTAFRVPAPGQWGWGARAAQRIVHLLLDCVRESLEDTEDRTELDGLRGRLYARLETLEHKHRAIQREFAPALELLPACEDVGARLDGLRKVMAGSDLDPAIRAEVDGAARDAFGFIGARFKQLFGPGPEPDLDLFLKRALAIEVVRRAFAADETFQTAQRLKFAQLTPCAPGVLFPRPHPTKPDETVFWDTPDEKLSGVKWGHFAAFYRESWRANDFMWGRLDAATRIMDLLVCPERAQRFAGDPEPPWAVLADALLPDNPRDGLVHVVAGALGTETVTRESLAEALQADLSRAGGGALTRRVCAAVAQFEILQHELPVLVESSRRDARLGAASEALPFKTDDWEQTLRTIAGGETFPERLGRDAKEEFGSALALRTSTHAAFVALAALRATKLPLTKALFAARTPLLPVAGLAALRFWYRLAVVLAFWATALVVAARVATTGTGTPTITDMWSRPVLTTYLAAIIALSVVAVPAWRAARSTGWARAPQLVWCALLLAAAGGVGVALALGHGPTQASLLGQDGAVAAPDELLGVVVAVTLVLPLALPVPLLGAWLDKLLFKPFGGGLALALMLAPWVAVAAWTCVLAFAEDTLAGWGVWTLWIGLVGAPLAMLVYVFASRMWPFVRSR